MSSKRADGSWMLTEICNFYLISGARLAPTGLISNQNYILHTLPPGLPCRPGYREWSEPGQRCGDAPRIDQIIRVARLYSLTSTPLYSPQGDSWEPQPPRPSDLMREISSYQSVSQTTSLLSAIVSLTSHLYSLNSLDPGQPDSFPQISSQEPTWRTGLSREDHCGSSLNIAFHKYGPMMRLDKTIYTSLSSQLDDEEFHTGGLGYLISIWLTIRWDEMDPNWLR